MIHSTTKILPAWYACLEELKMAHRTMPRDVSTRWNSTFHMLEFALKYCKAIDSVSAERDLELRPFELSATEWKIAEQLCDVLKVSSCTGANFDQRMFSFSSLFRLRLSLRRSLMHSLLHQILKHATLFFSRSTPNLATVIPAMDVIDEQLTNDSLNRTRFDVSIRASLGVAKRT
jgi:hypothetical protein